MEVKEYGISKLDILQHLFLAFSWWKWDRKQF